LPFLSLKEGAVKKRILYSALRGAVGFAVGAVVALAMVKWWFFATSPAGAKAPVGSAELALFGLFLSGAVGAVAVTWRRLPQNKCLETAFFFGIAMILAPATALVAVGYCPSASRHALAAYTLVGFAVGYAIAGAIGAIPLGWKYMKLAALAFGLAGLLSATLLILNATLVRAPSLQNRITLASVLAQYFVGGGLFGAFAASLGQETAGRETVEPGRPA